MNHPGQTVTQNGKAVTLTRYMGKRPSPRVRRSATIWLAEDSAGQTVQVEISPTGLQIV
jgi:hypothetical protein